MKRTSFANTACPIARSLEHVGDWWNILILRDAAYGLTRFDHFQKALGIGTAMLTRRLNQLVKAGLLSKSRYSAHPPRYEYLLTERGREFRQVLFAFVQFGNRHYAPEGESILVGERKTGSPIDLGLCERSTGRQVQPEELGIVEGPAANEIIKLRLALAGGDIAPDDFVEKLSVLRPPSKARSKRMVTA